MQAWSSCQEGEPFTWANYIKTLKLKIYIINNISNRIPLNLYKCADNSTDNQKTKKKKKKEEKSRKIKKKKNQEEKKGEIKL